MQGEEKYDAEDRQYNYAGLFLSFEPSLASKPVSGSLNKKFF